MCVTISGLYALTVIVDKRAVNSDNKDMFVVIHMIYKCTIHKVSILHALECDAMTWNAVKRLPNQSHVYVYCVCNMIRQLDMLSFYGTGNITC